MSTRLKDGARSVLEREHGTLTVKQPYSTLSA
jgi:hypothetical protein